nr:S phase cyclin A-associated protein in the endoplasmic reticulum isoform X2 [Parasteatoda tepidariorum]XP_042894979.1 S phase cyclin A-associated protein in the endoplasmic reticulum isoform X3 [Parasteatoda tepidariorum]
MASVTEIKNSISTSEQEEASQETIRRVVEEGLEARNLLNFIADGSIADAKVTKKPPSSPRPQSVSPKPPTVETKGINAHLLHRTGKRRTTLSRPKSRLRSASAGRNPEKDLRARYWTFLFENLHRAVDEIYQTCEMDESIVESKEAIMMLENYSKDFHALIQYININKDYEKTDPPNRPTSLAWEVRKSSPGKSLLKNVFIEKLTAGSKAKRLLCFETTNDFTSSPKVESILILPEKANSMGFSFGFQQSDFETKLDEIKPLDLSHETKNDCDIQISVIPESVDPNFPCNKDLIVNEVRGEKSEIPSSTISIKKSYSNVELCSDVKHKLFSESVSGANVSNKSLAILDEETTNLKGDSVTEKISSIEHSAATKLNSVKETAIQKINLKESTATQTINLNENSAAEKVISKDNYSAQKTNYPQDSASEKISSRKDSATQKIISKQDSSICKNDLKLNSSFKKINSKQDPSIQKVDSNQNSTIKNVIHKEKSFCESKSQVSDPSILLKRSRSLIGDSVTTNKVVSNKADLKVLSRKTTSAAPGSVKDKMVTNKNRQNGANGGKNSVQESIPVETSTSSNASKINPNACKESVCSILSKEQEVKKMSGPKPSLNNTKISSIDNIKQPVKSFNSVVKSESARSSCVKNNDDKCDNIIDKKKPVKPKSAESAIQRNISYVSTLSSRNQKEKIINDTKKPVRPSTLRLTQKSGSMISLNKTVGTQMLVRKTLSVEKIPEAVKSKTDDDSDGWEMVRGRNRSRNSPAKKIPFASKNQEIQAVQIAKLNQSRIGGFPYTNKSNVKTSTKTPAKSEASKKVLKQENREAKNDKKPPIETKNNTDSNKSDKTLKSHSLLETSNKAGIPQAGLKDKIASVNMRFEIWLNEIKNKPLSLDRTIARKINGDKYCLTRSSSSPNLHSELDMSDHRLSKTLCLSDQSLASQKYININIFKKKLSERKINLMKKKSKKCLPGASSLNGSSDENDTGGGSDDQDGTMSHDEFDVQCQELCDTAWKYKILEQQVRKLELSWGEQMDLFDMELRTPGRALEMHEKLSSPFRKKSLFESIRLCKEKQVKAQEQRERLLDEKAQKFKIIEKKRLEMKALIEERQEKQRIIMEQKLQKANEKRKKELQRIIRKAHDEEEKVNEIAFINSLEAQNKRHDLISKEKDHEARLQDIQEERQRKQEEKAAKEAAAEERRKILEAERLARLNEMQEKRKMRDHKVEQLFLVKEKERIELANQKARDRELRKSALNAQQQISIEELQKKIQLKQEESARRHEENMEQIRQKAFELSIRRCSSNNDDVPQPVPYDTKKICTICNVLIGSEVYLLSHLHGKKHQEAVKNQYQGKDPSSEELELYNLKHIVDASTDQLDPNIALDKERQKALKKRCKKLRQKMNNRGQDYESEYLKTATPVNSNVKTKMERIMNDIKKLLAQNEKNSPQSNLFTSMERCLNEIDSLLKKNLLNNRTAFQTAGGVTALVDLYNVISKHQTENNAFLCKKTINHLSNTTESLIDKSHDLCKYMLFSNKIGSLLDLLIFRLNRLIPDNISQLIANSMTKTGEMNIKVDITAWKLIHLLTGILINLSVEYSCSKDDENKDKPSDFQIRLQDMISYIVSIGIIDKLSQFFNSIQIPISNEDEIAAFLLECIHFLTTLIKLCADCLSVTSGQKVEDTTQLVATLRVTNIVGVISFLYGLLLHKGSSSRGEDPPTQLSKPIEILAHSAIQMFNHMAVMNLQAFQSILGSEGLSLQLRHIVSHLLWYCSHLTSEKLLHEIIILVGYFTILNSENQSIIQAGQRPTVLQQLCCLPFLYFCDPELTDVLFPSLIACCYNNPSNKEILQQEMSSELLSNYIEMKYLNSEDDKPKSKTSDIGFNRYWSFSLRIPKCYWLPAKNYFAIEQDQ